MVEISLRPVEQEDVDVFFGYQREPEGVALAAFSPRDHDEHRAHWGRILADEETEARTVVADGSVVGNVVSWRQDGHREIGYWIGKEHWGKGFATGAVSAFLDIDSARPLHAWIAVHNLGSIRVLEKCGFVESHRLEPDERGVRYVVMVLEGDPS